jgi:sugar (pentulose or hexulose) kinase
VLIVSGKLFHIEWIAQFCAYLFELTVEVSTQEDASLQGALRLTALEDRDPFFSIPTKVDPMMSLQFLPRSQQTEKWQKRFANYLVIASHEEKSEMQ